MNTLFRIGEVSDLFNIPQQTLRYYDKIGLFSPASINRETGYRYYTLSQLQQLHHIKTLKNINISTSDIKEFDDSEWDLDKLEELYSTQIDHINRSIEDLYQLKKGIQARQELYKTLKLRPKNKIVTCEYQERLIYTKALDIHTTRDQEIEYYRSFISLSNSIDYINVNPGFIVKKSNFLNDEFLASYIFLDNPSIVPEGYAENRLQQGTYCSFFIEDSYSKSESYYAKFQEYIKENNISLLSDVYEFCYTVMTNYKDDINTWEITAQIHP